MTEYNEPHLEERMAAALAKAKRLAAGEIETIEDLEMKFRLVISDHYGIPLLDRYFDGRILDDLAFEAYFIAERQNKQAETVSSIAVDNIAEAAKAVSDAFAEFEMPEISEAEKARMIKFMEDGKFPNE